MPPRSSSRKLLSNKTIAIQIILFCLITALLIWSDQFFSIKRIKVSAPQKTLVKGVESYYGDNLLFLSEEKLKDYLRRANPQIKEISVAKKLPNDLIIELSLYKASAALAVSQGYLQISTDGSVVSKTKNKGNLPVINYYQKLNAATFASGDKIGHKDILSSLAFLKKAEDLGLEIDAIDISGPDMIALNLNNNKVIFTTQKDTGVQNYQFETVIKQFKIEGREFKSLDFRFDKPVVKL